MLRSLSELEAVRGPARRITEAQSPRPAVRAAWPCGCVATGPSYARLLLHDDACAVHPPPRSQQTIVFRLPDVP